MSKFVFYTVKIAIETFTNKDDIDHFTQTNIKDFNTIQKNYLSFYFKSFSPINNIVKNLFKYLTNKFPIVFVKIRDYLQNKYTLDEELEQIILPIPSKIRYFSKKTIERYDNCLDFLNSLENSICATTKLENIQNQK